MENIAGAKPCSIRSSCNANETPCLKGSGCTLHETKNDSRIQINKQTNLPFNRLERGFAPKLILSLVINFINLIVYLEI